MVSGNELWIYVQSEFVHVMTKFTHNIVSGIELPAMYKVNIFNLTDSTYNY